MKNTKQQAYSLIELMVIITVIGILATISTVSYSNWRKSTTETQIKNDLNMAAAAMEDARNFDNNYPGSLPTTFNPSSQVTFRLAYSNVDKYCIEGASPDGTVYKAEKSTGVLAGACIYNQQSPGEEIIPFAYAAGPCVEGSSQIVNGICNYGLNTDQSNPSNLINCVNNSCNFSINGINNIFTGTNSFNNSKDITVSIWFKYSSLTGTIASIFSKSVDLGLQIHKYGGVDYLQSVVKLTTGVKTMPLTPQLANNQKAKIEKNKLYNAVLVISYNDATDKTKASIYINGDLAYAYEYSGGYLNDDKKILSIGNAGYPTGGYNATISGLKVYLQDLSVDNIKDIYSAGEPV